MNKLVNTDQAPITKEIFGQLNNENIYLFTLSNKNGQQVRITNFGGIVTSWLSEDKNGNVSDIVVGFKTLHEYLDKTQYHFGGIVGRYANRIAEGKFKIDNTTYQLEKNDNGNHIHGGIKGFDQQIWQAEILNESIPSLQLNYLSKDGEEGYPGNLNITVVYSFDDNNELKIEYRAQTDKATPVNLTNHTYFNLTGDLGQTILNHKISICADTFVETCDSSIPTGTILDVKNTAFDFNTSKPIKDSIYEAHNGYDHNYIVRKSIQDFTLAAVLEEEQSGRKLEVKTTEPGIQFYTGNGLDGKICSSDGIIIKKNTSLCLETQHFPDSPNQSHFPSTILKPNDLFQSLTSYKLTVN
jgi:aldose 1-epimerase